MRINQFSDIQQENILSIIINVGTPDYTTQTILSFRKESNLPLCVIDCVLNDSSESDVDYLEQLSTDYNFFLLSLPLQKHGATLDNLFQNINANWLMLIDSDVELLDKGLIELMLKNIEGCDDICFGTGHVSHPTELTKESMRHQNFGLYQERMFIPLTLLNTNLIRQAIIDAKKSFLSRMEHNDFPLLPKFSSFLFKRFRWKRTRNLRLKFLNPFKKTYFGEKPCCVFNDTGADIYMYLKYKKNYQFIEIPGSYTEYYNHYHGATRKKLSNDPYTGHGAKYFGHIYDKLEKKYGFEILKYLTSK